MTQPLPVGFANTVLSSVPWGHRQAMDAFSSLPWDTPQLLASTLCPGGGMGQSPSARCHPIRSCGGSGLSLLMMQLLLLLPAWQDAERLLPLIFAPSQQPSAWLVVCRHSFGIKSSQICAEVLVQEADLLPHCPCLFMTCASLPSPKHEFTLGFVFSSLTHL